MSADQIAAAFAGGWCVLWAAAAAAPAVLRHRGAAGGRWAVAAGVCGAAAPTFLAGLCVLRFVWPDEPPVWTMDRYAWRFALAAVVLTVAWAASPFLLAAAAAAAARAAADPAPGEGR